MKTDSLNAKILSHRGNLQRYARLLATQLAELEREYLHKRLAEEGAEVARLEVAAGNQAAKPKREEAPNPCMGLLMSSAYFRCRAPIVGPKNRKT
jgi:hypothetical protein